jgi:hypothetical protein
VRRSEAVRVARLGCRRWHGGVARLQRREEARHGGDARAKRRWRWKNGDEIDQDERLKRADPLFMR